LNHAWKSQLHKPAAQKCTKPDVADRIPSHVHSFSDEIGPFCGSAFQKGTEQELSRYGFQIACQAGLSCAWKNNNQKFRNLCRDKRYWTEGSDVGSFVILRIGKKEDMANLRIDKPPVGISSRPSGRAIGTRHRTHSTPRRAGHPNRTP
jgi:hypothetical protein